MHINTKKIVVSASIVLYKENINELKKTIASFLDTPLQKKIYLIDNSPTNSLEKSFKSPEIEYLFVGKNIGFGAGHNLIINKIKGKSNFHLILNPDIIFNREVIPNLIKKLEKDNTLTMVGPKVLYTNGNLQYSCRKYPTVKEIIFRRLKIFNKYTEKREYRNKDLTKAFNPEFISGCFMLFKTQNFIDIQGFDERYFLYMEDVDICRKIDQTNKQKLYYPQEQIIHIHRKGSAKKINLLIYHLSSAFKYFLKWGFK